jgi:hypothetical protein
MRRAALARAMRALLAGALLLVLAGTASADNAFDPLVASLGATAGALNDGLGSTAQSLGGGEEALLPLFDAALSQGAAGAGNILVQFADALPG